LNAKKTAKGQCLTALSDIALVQTWSVM